MATPAHDPISPGPRAAASGPTHDQSLGQLLGQLSEQSSRLVRAEIELAKAELSAQAKQAGIGAGMLAAAGLFGFFAFATLIATAVLGLANAVAPWLAALIVALALLVITAVLALVGKGRLQAGATKPELTVGNVKKDVDAVKEGFHS